MSFNTTVHQFAVPISSRSPQVTFIPLPSPGGFSRAINRSFPIINYQSKSAANNSRIPVWAVSNTQQTNLRPNRRTAPRPLAAIHRVHMCVILTKGIRQESRVLRGQGSGLMTIIIISDLITVSARHVLLKCASPRAMLCIRSNQSF